MTSNDSIIHVTDLILITGSNGFIGSKVVEALLQYGYTNLRCLVRPSSNLTELKRIISEYQHANIDIVQGNLQSQDDCDRIVDGASVIYHLAAGRGVKSYPDAYMNSVVTTRNLLEATLRKSGLKRIVNVSSFTVYSNKKIPRGGLLDESCEVESRPHLRGEAYCFAKVKQEELLIEYGRKYNIPYVIMRPGAVYGPGNKGLTGRVGTDSFGIYLHLGGSNRIPLSYVDNCADAIALAGVKKGVDGEIFNVVDDDLPTSRQLLRLYKKNVKNFRSIYVPRSLSYFLCYAWEKYSEWSEGQLPARYNRREWASSWKGNTYSNEKLKKRLGWRPKVAFQDAMQRYYEYQRSLGGR